jgi:hypothetical protein
MKWYFAVAIVVLFAVTVHSAIAASGIPYQRDNFEDGDFTSNPAWIKNTGNMGDSCVVSATNPLNGTYSLKCDGQNTDGWEDYTVENTAFTMNDSLEFFFSILEKTGDNADAQVYVAGSTTDMRFEYQGGTAMKARCGGSGAAATTLFAAAAENTEWGIWMSYNNVGNNWTVRLLNADGTFNAQYANYACDIGTDVKNMTVYFYDDSTADGFTFDDITFFKPVNVSAESPSLSVALGAPTNALNTTNDTVTFSYTPTLNGGAAITNCSLLINGSYGGASTASVTANVSNYFTNATLRVPSGGTYAWTVSCYDTPHTLNSTPATRSLVVYDTPITLSVALGAPTDSLNTSNSTVTFSYTPTVNSGGLASNCALFINGTDAQRTTTATVNQSNYFTNSTLLYGTYTWTVGCNDTVHALSSTPATRSLIVHREVPTVSVNLLAPTNNYNTTNTTIKFSYTPTFDGGALNNCSLVVNGTQVSTASPTRNVSNIFTYGLTTPKTYTWTVNCTDVANGASAQPATRNLIKYSEAMTPPTWVNPTPNDGVTNNTEPTLNASCGSNDTIYYVGTTNPPPLNRTINQSNPNNYTSTGSWTALSGIFDNDYSTYGFSTTGGKVYLNYTKPASSSSASWYFGFNGNTTPLYFHVLPDACFNAFSDYIYLQIAGNAINNADFLCHNGTDWYQLDTTFGGVTGEIGDEEVHFSYDHFTTSIPTSSTIYYRAQCFNVSSGEVSANTTVRSYTYDATFPSYVINGDNEFIDFDPSIQRTGFDRYDDALNLSINFTDNHDLYAWELNVTRLTDAAEMYYESNSSLNGLNEHFKRNLNVSNWTAGYYKLNFSISDSHTKQAIKNYAVAKSNKKLDFITSEGNTITVESDDAANTDAVKTADRYEFSFNFSDGKTKKRVFHIRASSPIVYRPNSGYKAHFIIPNADASRGGNWVDFEGVTSNVTVTRVSATHYTVTIDKVNAHQKFNSIGGMNVLSATFYWFRGTHSVQTQSASFMGFTTPSNLTVTVANGDAISNVNVTFNGTTTNVTTSACIALGTYDWCNQTYAINLTSPSSVGNNWVLWAFTDANPTNEHLDNTTAVTYTSYAAVACTAAPYNVTRITYNSYSEESPTTPLNQTMELYGTFSIPNTGSNQTLNLTFTSAPSFSICVYPNVSLTFDIYAKFTGGGSTHRSYLQNTTLDNSSVYTINIYNNATTTGYSTLRVTSRDRDTYAYVINALGVLQRFYVGEGVWRSVQMDRSGDYGLLVYDIRELTTDYRIQYYDRDNHLLLQTQSVKFSCSSGVCDVTQPLSDWVSTTTTSSITPTYSYNNVTNIITVNWTGDGLTTKTVNITVTHETMQGQQVACSSLQTGVGGTFSCNVSLYNSNFLVTLFDTSTNSITLNTWVDKSKARLSDYLSLGEQALWSFAILLTITAAGLFSPAGVIVTSTIGLVMIAILGIMTPITLTVLFIAGIIGFVLAVRLRT